MRALHGGRAGGGGIPSDRWARRFQTRAAPRALLFHAHGMHMPEPGRNIGNSSSVREVLAAWIVTLLAVAIGVLLLVFHEAGTEDRRVPRWYEPPVADMGEWADDLLVRRGAGLMPRSGSSIARDTLSKHR
jgi:hypothetical protein